MTAVASISMSISGKASRAEDRGIRQPQPSRQGEQFGVGIPWFSFHKAATAPTAEVQGDPRVSVAGLAGYAREPVVEPELGAGHPIGVGVVGLLLVILGLAARRS